MICDCGIWNGKEKKREMGQGIRKREEELGNSGGMSIEGGIRGVKMVFFVSTLMRSATRSNSSKAVFQAVAGSAITYIDDYTLL